MGNEQPKKSYQPRLQKQQLEISCIKVVGHLELQRDRRMNQGMQKEKVLISMINAPQRSKVDELHKASSIVSDMNYINGCNIVIRSLLICESVGKPDNIKELLPFIESVIWAAKHLNLNALQEFQNIMLNFFGAQGIDVTSSPQIDQELRKDFETVMPTPEDINAYMVKLAEKTGIPLEQINSAGHEFYNPQDRQQQQQQQQQLPNNNNQGPNVGGYFPPPNNQQGGGFGGQGQVYNINVQLPNNQQYPQQYQQNQQQFNQPPQHQQNWNQPPQNNSFNPSNNTSQNSNQQQQNQFNQQQQQPNQFNYQQQQQQQNQANYPGFNSNNNIQNPNNNNNFSNQQQQQQQQPSINSNNSNNNNSGLPQPQQQQFFQNNQFPSGQSSYPQKQPQDNINNNNQFNQPPQQQQNQNQFNQPPQQQQQGNDEDGLDSLEARLKRIREGV